mmetsp:Transcript_73580/g.137506  ORF Transcript_73580/g.137506 Transcript_73580/m.137506 type:complete len:459 (-) Transcript_73580:38-1414(-)
MQTVLALAAATCVYNLASSSAQRIDTANGVTSFQALAADFGISNDRFCLIQLQARLHGPTQLVDSSNAGLDWMPRNVEVRRAVKKFVSDTESLLSEVNRTVIKAMTQALTAVDTVADVVETGMSALEGMESLLGEHTMVATSSLNSVSDVVQRLLTKDQDMVDEFQDKMEQKLQTLHQDINNVGKRAIDSVSAARNATMALRPSAQSEDSLSKQPAVALATISSCVQHLQASLADGCITFEEAAAAAEAERAAANSMWRFIFEQVDEDGDGCISKDEWTRVAGPLSLSSKKHSMMLLERRASVRAASQMDRATALDHTLWAKGAESTCSTAKKAFTVASNAVASLVAGVRQTNGTLMALLEDAGSLSSSMFVGINTTIQNDIQKLPSAMLPQKAFEPITNGAVTALAVSVSVTRTLSKVHRTVSARLDHVLDGIGAFSQKLTETLRAKIGNSCDMGFG